MKYAFKLIRILNFCYQDPIYICRISLNYLNKINLLARKIAYIYDDDIKANYETTTFVFK